MQQAPALRLTTSGSAASGFPASRSADPGSRRRGCPLCSAACPRQRAAGRRDASDRGRPPRSSGATDRVASGAPGPHEDIPCPSCWADPGQRVRAAAWRRSRASKFASDSATTSSAMCACCRPQNSAHCPRKTPGRSASIHRAVVSRGSNHVCLWRFGTQKLWITSREVTLRTTGRPIGI